MAKYKSLLIKGCICGTDPDKKYAKEWLDIGFVKSIVLIGFFVLSSLIADDSGLIIEILLIALGLIYVAGLVFNLGINLLIRKHNLTCTLRMTALTLPLVLAHGTVGVANRSR